MLKYICIAIIFTLVACEKEQGKKAIIEHNPIKKARTFHNHDVIVEEVLQTTKYTYFRFKLHEEDAWAAVTKRDMKVGDIFPFEGGSEINDFKSKELNRHFESILFINDKKQHSHTHEKKAQHDGKPKSKESTTSISKVSDGITIAELFENKKKYSDKKVKIRGKVTKYNAAIMKRNWIHIQDGTKYNNLFDLTVTSKSEVSVGDVITIEGKVILNKDFGHGYTYDVLIEDAILVN